MNDLPLFMTPPEAAELLKVDPDKIRKWIERGELVAPNLSNGRRPRYRIARADLLAFLDRRSARINKPEKVTRRRRKQADNLPCRY